MASRQIAFTGFDGRTLHVLDKATGNHTSRSFGSNLGRCAMNEAGTLIAVGAGDCLHVLDSNLQSVQTHELPGYILSIQFMSQSPHIVCCCEDGTASIINTEKGSIERHTPMDEGRVHNICSLPSSNRIAVAAARGIGLYEMPTLRESGKLCGHTTQTLAITATPDERIVISGAQSGEIRAWDVDTGICLHSSTEHSSSVYSLAMCPSGTVFASVGRDNSVVIWNASTFKSINNFKFTDEIGCVAFSFESDVLLVGLHGAGIVAINYVTGEHSTEHHVDGNRIYGLACSPAPRDTSIVGIQFMDVPIEIV